MFTTNQGQLIIVEQQAQYVRLIFKWYVQGDEENKLLPELAIARKLSQMRAPTPGEVHHRPRKRPAGLWSFSLINRILTNET